MDTLTVMVTSSNQGSSREDGHGHTVVIKHGKCRALGASDRGALPSSDGGSPDSGGPPREGLSTVVAPKEVVPSREVVPQESGPQQRFMNRSGLQHQ